MSGAVGLPWAELSDLFLLASPLSRAAALPGADFVLKNLACLKVLDFLSLYIWPTVVAFGASESAQNEGLGFLKPLWQIVVASGGSRSSTIEAL